MDWKFNDDPKSACFTTRHVLNGSPILRVYHDYDGDWQFHGDKDQTASHDDGKIVCLAEVVSRDPSLVELHDLPCGWRAERSRVSEEWVRHRHHPFPTFTDDGYYLEDAVWLSEYLADIRPPDAETRENLHSGQYVKLVFRFASENSDRKDNECERMWVLISGVDGDGNYLGSIENDPYHDAAACGDTVTFHALHVAEVGPDA